MYAHACRQIEQCIAIYHETNTGTLTYLAGSHAKIHSTHAIQLSQFESTHGHTKTTKREFVNTCAL